MCSADAREEKDINEIRNIVINIDRIYDVDMDKRLRQFLAVAETGNVTAASDLLNVTQPTISVNLQKLEDDYGVKLFERSSRGVTLTEFGEVLYEHVKVIARVSNHATAELRQMKASREKAIRLGTGFSWWTLFVKDLVAAFQSDHRETSIHVDVCSSLDGLRNLLIGDIAFFLGTEVKGLAQSSGFRFEPLFEVSDSYFVGEQHPLAHASCHLEDLKSFPRLSISAFSSRHIGLVDRADLDPSFNHAVGAASSFLSTNSVFAGIDMLKSTDAILVYPTPTVPFFAAHDIARLDVKDAPATKVQIGLYELETKRADDRVGQIKRAIRAAVAALS